MGALALLVTAILATLVLYFWARKAQLEKQLLEEREENERMMSVAEDLERRLSHLKQQKKNTPALGVDVSPFRGGRLTDRCRYAAVA